MVKYHVNSQEFFYLIFFRWNSGGIDCVVNWKIYSLRKTTLNTSQSSTHKVKNKRFQVNPSIWCLTCTTIFVGIWFCRVFTSGAGVFARFFTGKKLFLRNFGFVWIWPRTKWTNFFHQKIASNEICRITFAHFAQILTLLVGVSPLFEIGLDIVVLKYISVIFNAA